MSQPIHIQDAHLNAVFKELMGSDRYQMCSARGIARLIIWTVLPSTYNTCKTPP